MEKELTDSLCRRVEGVFGSEVKTPKEFEKLSDSVFKHTGVLLSPTTLKRLWGYLDEKVVPRRSTLDVLSQYVGWSCWDTFTEGDIPEVESGMLASDKIDVINELKTGDRIRLTWHPARMCVVEYEGYGEFTVMETEATKLKPGDTFQCFLIVSGEPLYLENLTTPGHRTATYVCGRTHGVRFTRLATTD